MAALVTLAQAKDHLRVTGDASNSEIDAKVLEASAIILDYLKGRSLVVSTLTRSGAVATVTTATPHGVTSADLVVLRGADQPEYNGSFVATVTSTTVLTVPVTGSPDTPATGVLMLRAEQAWTDLTVPKPVQAAVLLALEDLYEHRPIDWTVLHDLLVRFRDPAFA
jgi:hypothetical protein